VHPGIELQKFLNETNGCNNVEDIYFLSYINMFRASLCPSSGYKCGDVA
jgi:hypothetical protein